MPLSQLSALKNPSYRTYFFGQLVSMAGSRMQAMVQAWIVYEMTHSALWLGLIQFTGDAAAFLASPMAGVLADQKDRRKVTIWVSVVGLLQALTMTILYFTGTLQIWHIALLAALLGLTNSFEITTRHAFAVDLVGREHLSSALSLNSICVNGSRIFGPSLAGVLLATFGKRGEGYCFLFNSLSYVAVLWSLARIRVAPAPILQVERRGFLSHFGEALRYARETGPIRRLLVFSTFLSFIGFPYIVLLPVISTRSLHGDANTLAWLTAWTGLGAILAGLGVGASVGMDPRAPSGLRKRLLVDVVILGGCFALLGMSHQFWLSCLACGGIGYFLMGAFPRINNAIQLRSREGMRGRVISLYTMTFLGAAPLGSLLNGWLVDRFGVEAVSLGIGMACVLATVAVTRLPRAVARMA